MYINGAYFYILHHGVKNATLINNEKTITLTLLNTYLSHVRVRTGTSILK